MTDDPGSSTPTAPAASHRPAGGGERCGPGGLAGLCGLLAAATATATMAGGDLSSGTWQDIGLLTDMARAHVTHSVVDPGGRLAVTVVSPDPRLRMPACATPVAETPEGQRLWGWSQVRIRCPGEGGWSLNIRVRVQVMAPALVTRRAVSAGRVFEADDVQAGEIDLTATQRAPLKDPTAVIGRVARLGLAAGQPIGAEHLRLPVVVRRGAPLEVTATVGQVSVTSAGTAMQDGTLGELIRIKVPGGRTLQGVVTGEGRVAVQMQ